jgi:hypothetical protein
VSVESVAESSLFWITLGGVVTGVGGLFVAFGQRTFGWAFVAVGVLCVLWGVLVRVRHFLASREDPSRAAGPEEPATTDMNAVLRAELRRIRDNQMPYEMPPVVYDQGRWWFLLKRRDNKQPESFRCQVFDSLQRNPSKLFTELEGNVVATYPTLFGIKRPLPTGLHTVVWSVLKLPADAPTGELQYEEVARQQFDVQGDKDRVRDVMAVLDSLRMQGEWLAEHLAVHDWDEWEREGIAWAGAMDHDLKDTTQFEPSDTGLHFFQEPAETREESARRSIAYRLALLDQIATRFQ